MNATHVIKDGFFYGDTEFTHDAEVTVHGINGDTNALDVVCLREKDRNIDFRFLRKEFDLIQQYVADYNDDPSSESDNEVYINSVCIIDNNVYMHPVRAYITTMDLEIPDAPDEGYDTVVLVIQSVNSEPTVSLTFTLEEFDELCEFVSDVDIIIDDIE